MMVSTVMTSRGRVIAAPSVSWANSRSMRFLDSDAYAANRISAPSSSRTFDLIDEAMYIATSSGSATASTAAFLRRIAMRTSSWGGSMSASRPHANRVRSRSAIPAALPVGRAPAVDRESADRDDHAVASPQLVIPDRGGRARHAAFQPTILRRSADQLGPDIRVALPVGLDHPALRRRAIDVRVHH